MPLRQPPQGVTLVHADCHCHTFGYDACRLDRMARTSGHSRTDTGWPGSYLACSNPDVPLRLDASSGCRRLPPRPLRDACGFESHLRYLSDAGYHTITLDDLLYALAQGRPLPAKPVILTFDDGYEDNYTNAFALLRKYGMVGHFSVLTDVVNAETPGYMTWPQIEEMAANGQHFGSHARNHSQNLSGKSVDFLVWHALGGMEAIQEHLGYHPRWITYPSGKYDAQTIAVYKSAGYWGGLTTDPGVTHTSDGVFELERVRIHGSTTAEALAALLN